MEIKPLMHYSRRRIVKVNSPADLTFAGRGEAGGRPHESSEHESSEHESSEHELLSQVSMSQVSMSH